MASVSSRGALRLLGRGHAGSRTVLSRFTQAPFSQPAGLTLRRGFASDRQRNVLGLSFNPRNKPLQKSHVLPGLVFTRHYSKDTPAPAAPDASEAVSAVASSPLPAEPSSSAAEAASTLTETASSVLDTIHTPLQYGDFSALGLAHWTPAGIVQWTMEIINTTTHLPWFWTIVAGSAFWRLIVVPTSISGLRNSSRLQPYQEEVQKVQAEMGEASKKNDLVLRQKTALKLKGIYEKAGVSVFGGLVAPIVQIPVTLGVFFGVRNMCNLPVEQLKWSGLNLLPDLTIADPTWVLPLLVTALVNIQISVGAAEMDLKTRPNMGHLMNGFRVVSLLAVGVTASFPAGLLVSLLTTSTLTILQSLALQYKPFRRYLGISDLPSKTKMPSMKQTVDYLISSYKERIKDAKEAQLRNNQRANASEQMKRFEEARRK